MPQQPLRKPIRTVTRRPPIGPKPDWDRAVLFVEPQLPADADTATYNPVMTDDDLEGAEAEPGAYNPVMAAATYE